MIISLTQSVLLRPSSVRPSDGPVAAEVEDHVEFTIPEYKLMLNPLSTFTACWDNCLLVLVGRQP